MKKVDRKYIEKLIKEREERGYVEKITIKCLDMHGINLENMNLSNIEFEHCNLKFASFYNSKLLNCEFTMCNMYNAYFKKSTLDNISIKNCDLSYAFFVDSSINDCLMLDNTMYSSRFMVSNISETRISESRLEVSNFDNSTISLLTIENCYCKRSSFREANIKDCNFRENIFENSTFADSMILRTSFIDSNLSRSRFGDTKFVECLLNSANFYASDITSRTEFVDCKTNRETRGLILACPAVGEFIAWKKVIVEVKKKISDENSFIEYKNIKTTALVQLLIPEDALRSSSTTTKCRANKAKVIGIEVLDPEVLKWTPMEEWDIHSDYDRSFKYHIGDELIIPNFDDNRWNECAPGIHFFMDKEDAKEY